MLISNIKRDKTIFDIIEYLAQGLMHGEMDIGVTLQEHKMTIISLSYYLFLNNVGGDNSH